MIKCPECGKEISDKSDSCVYCGCPADLFENSKECANELLKNDTEQHYNSEDNLIKSEESDLINSNQVHAIKGNDITGSNINKINNQVKKQKKRIRVIVLGSAIIFAVIIIGIFIVLGHSGKTNNSFAKIDIDNMSDSEIYDTTLECLKDNWDYATAAEYMGKINYNDSKDLAKIYQQFAEMNGNNGDRRLADNRFYYYPTEYAKLMTDNLENIYQDTYYCLDQGYAVSNTRAYFITFRKYSADDTGDPYSDEDDVTITMYDVKENGSFAYLKVEAKNVDEFSNIAPLNMSIFLLDHSSTYTMPIWNELIDNYPDSSLLTKDGITFIISSAEEENYSIIIVPENSIDVISID